MNLEFNLANALKCVKRLRLPSLILQPDLGASRIGFSGSSNAFEIFFPKRKARASIITSSRINSVIPCPMSLLSILHSILRTTYYFADSGAFLKSAQSKTPSEVKSQFLTNQKQSRALPRLNGRHLIRTLRVTRDPHLPDGKK